MEAFLKANPKIDVLFAHNDDMGLGAIEAIEAAGKVPGKDIKIITIDAVKDGMQALADGKINFIVECSPLLGPQLMDLVKKVEGRRDGAEPGSSPRRPRSPRSRPRPRCPTASTEPAATPTGGRASVRGPPAPASARASSTRRAPRWHAPAPVRAR